MPRPSCPHAADPLLTLLPILHSRCEGIVLPTSSATVIFHTQHAQKNGCDCGLWTLAALYTRALRSTGTNADPADIFKDMPLRSPLDAMRFRFPLWSVPVCWSAHWAIYPADVPESRNSRLPVCLSLRHASASEVDPVGQTVVQSLHCVVCCKNTAAHSAPCSYWSSPLCAHQTQEQPIVCCMNTVGVQSAELSYRRSPLCAHEYSGSPICIMLIQQDQ